MRGGVLAVVVGLVAGACGPDAYGTYLVADGGKARIAFDHAEFFFGTSIDGAFASKLAGPATGDVYRRIVAETDVSVPAGKGGLTATYYLPAVQDNTSLDYVLVVAYDGQGAPVGVGDAQVQPPPGDAVIEQHVALEPPAGVEVWGDQPRCARWDRSHGDTVGVVRDNDRDCDSAPAAMDCNDLEYCTPGDPICTAAPRLCLDTCTIGCPMPGGATGCAPTVCLFGPACTDPICANTTTIAERLVCVAKQTAIGHIDYQVPVLASQLKPCVDHVDVALPNGLECPNPRIEFAELLPDGYKFAVDENGNTCRVTLLPPTPIVAFHGDHHLLVSFDAPDPTGPRYSMFFGLVDLQYMQCTSTVTSVGNLTINTCQ